MVKNLALILIGLFSSMASIGQDNEIIVTYDLVEIDCPGDSTGVITVYAHVSSENDILMPLTYNIFWGGPTITHTTTLDPNDTVFVATDLPAGNYQVAVNDANGGFNNNSGGIFFPRISLFSIPPLLTNPSTNPVSCVGLSDGDAIVSTTGGTAPYNYSWEGLTDTDSIANDVPAGEYRVIVTDNNGCQAFDTLQVAEGDTLEARFTVSDICQNELTIITDESVGVDGATSYDWDFGPNSSPANSNTPGNQNVTYSTPGNKNVSLTLNNGTCTHTLNQQLRVFALPTITTSGDITICETDTTNITSSGALTYLWTPVDSLSSPGTANTMAYPSATTTYTVSGTDVNNCTNTADVTVTVNPLPNISTLPTTDTTICENNSAQLVASGAATYEWSPATGLTATNIPNPIATPLSDQTYKVVASSGANCKDSTEISITVNPAPNVTITPDDSICIGQTIQLNAGGGIGYDWFPKDGTLSATNIDTPIASPTTTTEYTAVVTGANGCIDSAKVTIEVNPLPTTTITANDTICENESINLTVTGGDTYAWTPNDGSLSSTNISTPTASPNSTTYYYVQTTDNKGCIKTDSVEIVVRPIPVATTSPTPDTAICIGQSVTLNGFGGDDYLWLPGNLTTQSITVSPTVDQVYRVVASNGFNCTDTASINVTVNPLPTIVITAAPNDSICLGDSTELTASGAQDYSWAPLTNISSPLTDITFVSPTINTTYTVTGTDANGCINSENIDISVLGLPTASDIPNDTICEGESRTLTASGGVGYLWSPATGLSSTNTATTIATPLVTTEYIVTVSDAIGCSSNDTTLIVVNPLPITTTSPDVEICANDTTPLTATGGIDYSWSDGASLTDANIANPLAFPGSTTNFMVTVTDNNGCQSIDSVLVTVNPLPVLVATPAVDTICRYETTNLNVSGALTYTWSPDSTLNANTGTDVVASPLTDHIYIISGTDANNCVGTTTAEVLIEPVITINIVENDTICQGDTVLLSAAVINGVSFAWTSATDIIDDPNQVTTRAVPQTTQWFTLEVTNAANCTNEDSLQVVVETAPTLNLSAASDSLCQGDSTLLVASGNGVNYTWFNPAQFEMGDSIYVQPTTTTNYRVVSETVGGCTRTRDTTIFVDPIPVASGTADQAICFDDTIRLVATGGIRYAWSPNVNISSIDNDTVFVSPDTNTTYTVEVFNSVGCSDLFSTTITVNQLPSVSISGDSSICIGETTTLTATAPTATGFTWTPSDSLSSTSVAIVNANPTLSTTYIVEVVDANTCVNTDTVFVEVNELPVIITSSDVIMCEGDNTTLTASGGTAYNWTPTTGLATPTLDNTLASPTVTTVYNVEVTDNKGCVNDEDVTVQVNPAPFGTLNLSADTVCYGTPITATAVIDAAFTPNPFGGYSFDGGNSYSTIDQLTFTQLTAGDTTISVIFRDQFDCQVSAAVNVTATTLPQVTMEIDTIILPDCTPPPGEFRVHSLSGGLAPYFISLNGGVAAQTNDTTYANLAPGIYAVNVTDAFGCNVDEQLNFLSSITFDTLIVDPLCNSETTGSITISNVQGGVEPYEFSIDNQATFSTNGSFAGLGDGIHTIFLRDNGNCLIELNFDLEEPEQLITTELNTTNILCAGTQSGQFSIEVTGGTPPFSADNGIANLNGSGPFTFLALSAGTGTVNVTDGNGCNSDINYDIEDAQPIEAFFTEINPPSGCNTADGEVRLDSTINGSGNYQYSLDGGASFKNETSFQNDLQSLESGIYVVIIEDFVLGCTDSSSFTLTTANGIYLDSIRVDTTAPTCVGTDGIIALTNVFGAPQPYNFQLRVVPTDSITHPMQPDSTISGISQGDYTVVIRDALGCNYRLPVFMPGAQELDFTTDIVDAKCGVDDGTITINASGGSGGYEYVVEADTQIVNLFDSLAPMTYTVQLSDTTDASCIVQKEVTVGTSDIDAVLEIDSVTCFGIDDGQMNIVNLLNTDSTNFLYEFGTDSTDMSGNYLSYDSLRAGLHTLWIKQINKSDGAYCIYPDWELYEDETIEGVFYDSLRTNQFFVGGPDLLTADVSTLPSAVDFPDGTIFINNVQGGTAPYSYSVKDTAIFFNYDNINVVKNQVKGIGEGEYVVYVRDSRNCTEPMIAKVGRKLYIPNIFTPNGDGLNDTFIISNLPANNKLRIYDRWGIVSYKARGYNNDWDGGDQPDGMYYYELDTPTKRHKGWVQIVRD